MRSPHGRFIAGKTQVARALRDLTESSDFKMSREDASVEVGDVIEALTTVLISGKDVRIVGVGVFSVAGEEEDEVVFRASDVLRSRLRAAAETRQQAAATTTPSPESVPSSAEPLQPADPSDTTVVDLPGEAPPVAVPSASLEEPGTAPVGASAGSGLEEGVTG